MLKYLTMGCCVALLILSVGCYELYQHTETLAATNATLAQSLSEAKSANDTLMKTIADQTATRKAISDNVIANEQMRQTIDKSTQQTIVTLRKSMKDFACYETPFPADAVDAICVLQPSDSVCHKN